MGQGNVYIRETYRGNHHPSTRPPAAAAASLSATGSAAEQLDDKSGGERSRPPKPLMLHIVLPDGQVVDLKASELVIDFGGNNRLSVKPDGLLPTLDPGGNQQPGESSKS
jgi:hypothetical protein